MRTIDIALNDLSQIFSDRKILLFLVLMPIAFTIFMGFAMSSITEPEDPRLSVGFVNEDPGGAVADRLREAIEASEGLIVIEMERAEADQKVEQGDIAGALIVPEGFSASALEGSSKQLTLIADDSSTTGQALVQLLSAPVSRLMSAAAIAVIGTEPEQQTEREAVFHQAVDTWQESAESSALIKVELAAVDAPEAPFGGNPYNQSSPGILIQFAMFSVITSAAIVVQERKSRTIQRLLTTAAKTWEIVAGHTLAMFVLAFIQSALLVVFGQVFMEVRYLDEPVGIFAIAVALCLWVASLGLLIGVIAKGDEQVTLFGLIVMFVFSALGGAWMPMEVAGGVFLKIARLTPTYWAMDGIQDILYRGLGAGAAVTPAAVLLGYTAALFGLGVWLFRKEIGKG